MSKLKINLYIGALFLVITIIGLNLLIFGIILLNQFNEPLPTALNSILIGIILLPIGMIFLIIFLFHAFSSRKGKAIKQNN
ncbi:MAG: hypothetical protein ACTSYC_08565 [Promethearchaeota archaeon]